jgi:hypothetical protein
MVIFGGIMSSYKEFLLKYSQKIVHLKYADRFNNGSAIGVILFSDDGFTVYNGGQINCFEGFNRCHDTLKSLEEKNDVIPYENVTHVGDVLDNGDHVDSYLQKMWRSKYINVKNMIFNNIVDSSIFSLSKPLEQLDDHHGMVYNPYTDTWSFL